MSQNLHLKRPGNVSFESSRRCFLSLNRHRMNKFAHISFIFIAAVCLKPKSFISTKGRVWKMFYSSRCLDPFLLTCKNKNPGFHPEVKGRRHKVPTVFDGLIDIQHVPDSSLITEAQTSGRMAP